VEWHNHLTLLLLTCLSSLIFLRMLLYLLVVINFSVVVDPESNKILRLLQFLAKLLYPRFICMAVGVMSSLVQLTELEIGSFYELI